MSKPKFVYVMYLAATADKVFRALTDEKTSRQYWSGYSVSSDWTIGSSFAITKDGKAIDTGTVLEYDPPRRLSYTFQHVGLENEKPSRVVFDLEETNGQVKLTVTHDDFEDGSKLFPMISNGWPIVLSSLKSLLETGTALHPVVKA